MRRYETVFIVNPELSEEERQPLLDKLQGIMSEDQGMFVKFDDWGMKKLAYVVKKQTRGYYVLMDFCGDGVLVKEIERNMRLDDRVLKYMTVLKDKTVDLEAIKEEIESAKAQESGPKPAEQEEDEGEDKGDVELVNSAEAPVSDTEVSKDTAETNDQEEQK